jgi:hypothetical protein
MLTLAGLPGWQCPMLRATGIPCPGCGLSRGCAALVRGHWHSAISIHAFAPLLVAGVAMIALAAVLPKRLSAPWVACIEKAERATGLSQLFLVLLLFYWLGRLLYDPAGIPR